MKSRVVLVFLSKADNNITEGESKSRISRLRENHQGQGLLQLFLIMKCSKCLQIKMGIRNYK